MIFLKTKIKLVIIISLIITVGISCTRNKDVNSEICDANHEKLSTGLLDTLKSAINHLQLNTNDSIFSTVVYHCNTLRNKERYLEYTRSSGLLHNKIKVPAKFISSSDGWVYTKFNYYPVLIEKSKLYDNDGKELKKLYKRRSYAAEGYHNNISPLLSALFSYGPQNKDKLNFFDFYLLAHEGSNNVICYGFDSKLETSIKLNPFRGTGKIWINRTTCEIDSLTSNNIEYHSIFHGVEKNFGRLPRYDTKFKVSFKTYRNGFRFYENIEISKKWVRDIGGGRQPRRSKPDVYELVENDYLCIRCFYKIDSAESIKPFVKHLVSNTKDIGNFSLDNDILIPVNIERIRDNIGLINRVK